MSTVNPYVDRVLDVAAFLMAEARGHKLGDVAESLGLSKSATHRMLQALCEKGWAEQDADSGVYRLTLRLPALAHHYLATTKLPDLIRPVVERVARESREHARVAVVTGDRINWLTEVQGSTSGLIFQGGLGRLPIHAAANGKAWLATLTDEAASRIVLDRGFGNPDELGPNAVRSIDVLLRHLAETRRRGWALNVEEAEAGVITVAAAVTPGGEGTAAVATVSASGPAVRFTAERATIVAETVIVPAAKELSVLWPMTTPSQR